MTGVERPHTSYVLDTILLDGAMLLKASLRGSRRSRGFPFFHVHPLASLFFLAFLLSRCCTLSFHLHSFLSRHPSCKEVGQQNKRKGQKNTKEIPRNPQVMSPAFSQK